MLTVDQIQIAAKMFEHDGIECFSSVKEKFGKEVALILVVAHLRHKFGSERACPSEKYINVRVVKFLKKKGIIS
ncbi:MAG: hypothetical protein COS71_00300 [Candidatus Moranbacteria bacterium CG06_land_8_20_14_3_00_40_12]|nr:MAG: hypothetical protein COX31_02905 [Candidatus Moranbacteria bacterium CG23_combo_of_CG06-09_8_20_14_all_40_16]PIU81061.1 MAG: hypothetical protein COS71_00300 [Candidatus Moranbacteria bacterium CG06_land_8_20_14_3_00_40_12]